MGPREVPKGRSRERRGNERRLKPPTATPGKREKKRNAGEVHYYGEMSNYDWLKLRGTKVGGNLQSLRKKNINNSQKKRIRGLKKVPG